MPASERKLIESALARKSFMAITSSYFAGVASKAISSPVLTFCPSWTQTLSINPSYLAVNSEGG